MDVPVISLCGATAVSRAGLSLMTNLGLPELVAKTPAQFIEITANLARDRKRLAQLRSDLRDRMQRSPLMDAASFTRNLESAYQAMWRTWCETQGG